MTSDVTQLSMRRYAIKPEALEVVLLAPEMLLAYVSVAAVAKKVQCATE